MALTAGQRQQILEVVDAIHLDGVRILGACEVVSAALRVETVTPDDVNVPAVLQAAKSAALTHANAIVTLLTPP